MLELLVALSIATILVMGCAQIFNSVRIFTQSKKDFAEQLQLIDALTGIREELSNEVGLRGADLFADPNGVVSIAFGSGNNQTHQTPGQFKGHGALLLLSAKNKGQTALTLVTVARKRSILLPQTAEIIIEFLETNPTFAWKAVATNKSASALRIIVRIRNFEYSIAIWSKQIH